MSFDSRDSLSENLREWRQPRPASQSSMLDSQSRQMWLMSLALSPRSCPQLTRNFPSRRSRACWMKKSLRVTCSTYFRTKCLLKSWARCSSTRPVPMRSTWSYNQSPARSRSFTESSLKGCRGALFRRTLLICSQLLRPRPPSRT